MPQRQVIVTENECSRCGYKWILREGRSTPSHCANSKCTSIRWNIPKIEYQCQRCLHKWIPRRTNRLKVHPKECSICKSHLWSIPRRNNLTKYYENVLNGHPLCKVSPKTMKTTKNRFASAKIALQRIEEERRQKIENDKELGRQLLYSGLEVT